MRILLFLSLLFASISLTFADRTVKFPNAVLTLSDTQKCEIKQVVDGIKPEYRGSLKGGYVIFNDGRKISLCYIEQNGTIFAIDTDGNYGEIPSQKAQHGVRY